MSKFSIQVENLKKYYGPVKAVDGISFKVEAGTIFGMLGPNGAGKTTTIETMIGLNKKDEGDIRILGLNPGDELQELKERIGVQLQTPSLFTRLKVKEIAELFAGFYPDPLPVEEAIRRVGLENKKDDLIDNLSGGQRHRLAVGLAMVSNGEVIFLDEPTTGLDPQARRQLWEVIRQLKAEGITVFLTTHYMDEAEQLCDDLVIVDHGKIIAQGSPQSLIDTYFKDRAIEFIDPGFTPKEKETLADMDLVNRLNDKEDQGRILVYTDDVLEGISSIMRYAEGIEKPIDDIMVRHATLEDVFLKLTGRGIRE